MAIRAPDGANKNDKDDQPGAQSVADIGPANPSLPAAGRLDE